MKSGLAPAVKNHAAHGGEDCAARRVKNERQVARGFSDIFSMQRGKLHLQRQEDCSMIWGSTSSVRFTVDHRSMRAGASAVVNQIKL